MSLKIGIDTSPTKNAHSLRGIGFYTKNLIEPLISETKEKDYVIKEIGSNSDVGNYDLIHYPYFDLFSLSLPINKKTKTVVTIHDVTPLVFPENYPLGFRGKINLMIQKFSLKSVDRVITDSENSKKDIIKYLNYPENKIEVIYLAAGEEFKQLENGGWRMEIIEKYNLPKKFVLYVGDVNWNKNILGLARTCRELELDLVMVGKQLLDENFDRLHPENKDRLKFLEEFKNDLKVKRLGFISSDDLVKIYNLAIVYCQPSFYEGFGLPILEAMSCGCPVVSSNTSSMPEVAGDAAIYFDPTSTGEMKEKLLEVVNNEKLQKDLRVKGLVNSKKFSWLKTAAQTLETYMKVLANKLS